MRHGYRIRLSSGLKGSHSAGACFLIGADHGEQFQTHSGCRTARADSLPAAGESTACDDASDAHAPNVLARSRRMKSCMRPP
jgi:hypothetical protein